MLWKFDDRPPFRCTFSWLPLLAEKNFFFEIVNKIETEKESFLLVFVLEIAAKCLFGYGTFAHFQIGCRIILNVIDAHLVADREAAEYRFFVFGHVVVAGGD